MKISNGLIVPQGILSAGEEYLRALECLYEVIDPEVGINIVDLGLVYSLEVEGDAVRVEMTMTTPACPLHAYLTSAAESAILEGMPGVRSARVALTFDPPWDPAMMSRQAKYQLGW